MATTIPCPEPNAYYLVMRPCRADKHEECEGRRDRTNHIDPHPTVCRCCTNGHYRGEAKQRHTEWKINRNWLRAGDPCKVKGLSTDCVFRALLTNGKDMVEVVDRRKGGVHRVSPDRVTRVAKTGGRR